MKLFLATDGSLPFAQPMVRWVLLVALGLGGCFAPGDLTDQQHLQRAQDLKQQGKISAALIEARNALQKNPQNAEARSLLGEIYVEQGHGREAEEELKRARELGIHPETLKGPLGNALLLQRRYARVMDEIKPGPDSSPFNVARILEIRGRAQLGLGRLEEGCALFRQALEQDAQHVPAYWGLALCAATRGSIEQARAELEKARKLEPKNSRTWIRLGDLERGANRLPAAEAAYSSALEHARDSVEALLGRAVARLQDKKWKESEQDIQQALSLAKGHPVAIHLQGVLAYSQGKYQEAKTLFETTLRTIPDYPPAVLWLGFSNVALQNYEQAVNHLSQFLARYPQAVQVQALLALVQARLGVGAEAKKTLAKLQGASLDDPKSLVALGQAYYFLKEGDLAVQYLQRAVEREPEAPDTRLNLALAYLQKGQMPEAVEQLEKALQLKPDLRRADELLIQTLIWEQQFDKALKAVDEFQARQPKSPVPPTYRGSVLLTQDRRNAERAKREFMRALELEPGYAPAGHNLAMMAWEEGKLEEARKYYESVLKHNKDSLPTLLALYALEARAKRPEQAKRVLETAVEKHPAALAPALLLGQTYLSEGKPLKAIEVTREAERANPGSDRLLDLRGRAYLAAGDPGNALAASKRLALLRPDSADAQYQLATVYAARKDTAAYREALLKALSLQAQHLQAKIALAQLELAQGNGEEAVRLARELQKEHPKVPAGFVIESDALNRKGANQQSVKVLEHFQAANSKDFSPRALLIRKYLQSGEKEKALRLARETEQADPKRPAALDLLGSVQLAVGDNRGAVETYAKLAQLDPKSPEAHLKLAKAHRAAGSPTATRAALSRALELRPDYLEAQIGLAAVEAQAGRHEEALQIAQKIQKQRPKLAVGFVTEGDLLWIRKEYAKAANAYEAAQRVQGNGAVVTKLHHALERAGQMEAADERVEQWLKEHPGDHPTRLYLADAYMQRGRHRPAIAHYQSVLKQDPQNVLALNNLAWVYYRENNPRALELAEQAYRLAPDQPHVLDTLGWLLLEQGKLPRATQLLEKAASLAPDAPDIRYHYAVALAKSGRKAKAREEIERLLASGKRFPQEQEARQLLQGL